MAITQGTSASDSVKGPSAYVPPKGWDDLTDAEKIERLREVVRGVSATQAYHFQEFNWLKNLFFKHDHDPRDGKLVVEPETYRQHGYGELSANSTQSDKPYF